jgi:excisionase family DNA binding protein
MPDEELRTVDKVAEIMKVNARTVRNDINSGELAAVMIGKREYRVRREALNEFIKQREKKKGTA